MRVRLMGIRRVGRCALFVGRCAGGRCALFVGRCALFVGRCALIIGGCALFVGGCAQLDTGHVATERLLDALDCPEEETDIDQIGAYRYRGDGCGRTVTVACTASSFEPRCVPEQTAGAEAPDLPPDLPPDARAAADPPARSDAADSDAARSDPREAGSQAAPPERGAPEEAAVEVAIRQGLDARSADILACVDRPRVAVRAGYAPDGSVALSLRGDLANSPEERCVQDALDGVRVPSEGASGVVIHLVTTSATPGR